MQNSALISWWNPARLKSITWDASQILAFGCLTALAAKAQFFLPFTPVPITLQSWMVILSGVILGARKGALSQCSLIAMGALGAPVFSLPVPGIAVLLGPTGGYILGFVLGAYVTGWLFERFQPKAFLIQFAMMFVGSLFIFLPGMIWLSQYVQTSLLGLFQIGFIPFMPGGVLKCLLAVAVWRVWTSLGR